MPDEDEPRLDCVLSVLSQRRARFICYYLMASDISEVNELFLTMEVAAWETGIDPSQVPTEKVMYLLEELRDNLLPRLDAAELIEYNAARGTVRYGDPPELFADLVNVCQSIEQPDSS